LASFDNTQLNTLIFKLNFVEPLRLFPGTPIIPRNPG
jgi:hypothetical protein